MPPGQDTNVDVEDRGDGTYSFKLLIKSPCDLKLIISVLKEKPISATAVVDPKNVMEFAPISLSITSVKAYQAKQEREARRGGLVQPNIDLRPRVITRFQE